MLFIDKEEFAYLCEVMHFTIEEIEVQVDDYDTSTSVGKVRERIRTWAEHK